MTGSVIDTLVTVFEADTTNYQRGAKDVDKTTGDINKKFFDNAKASDIMSKGLVTLAQKAASVVAGFLALKHISDEVLATNKSAISLKNLSAQTGSSMQDISAWGHAMVEAGGDADEFNGALLGLTRSFRDIQYTGDSASASALRFLGVGVVGGQKLKPVLEYLPKIAEGLKKVDEQTAYFVGEKLGFSPAMVRLLRDSSINLQELVEKKKELGALDEKNAAVAIKFNVAMDETDARMQGIYKTIGAGLLPAFNQFLKVLDVGLEGVTWGLEKFFVLIKSTFSFIESHKVELIAAFTYLAFVLREQVYGALGAVLLRVSGLAFTMLDTLVPAIAATAEGFAAMWGAAFLPVTIIAGGIFLIGEAIHKVFNGDDVRKSLLFKGVHELFDLTDAVASRVADVAEAFGNLFSVGKSDDADTDAGYGGIAGAAQTFANANNSPLNSQTSTSITGDSVRTNNYNIKATSTVNTQASDPAAVSKAVGGNLHHQLRSAVSQNDNGLRA